MLDELSMNLRPVLAVHFSRHIERLGPPGILILVPETWSEGMLFRGLLLYCYLRALPRT